jgi:UDP-N-acetylmuramoylalanine--D-glutamate ligase
VRDTLASLSIPEVSHETAEWLVVSPGIPPEKYPNVKAEYISEIELAYRLWQKRPRQPTLIAVTGTNGKSTVTSMIAHILDCPALGNIGVPYITTLSATCEEKPPPFLALELSSYQLETCVDFHPKVALILNLTPDHLERHKTMEAYMAAKAKIGENQTPQDVLILGESDLIAAHTESISAQKITLSSHHPYWEKIQIPLAGDHNRLNALAAILACEAVGVPWQVSLEKLGHFTALEHRLEWVKTLKDRAIYNDSKGTNPDSTQIAIQAFDQPIHLILGGKDKGLNLKDFQRGLPHHVKSIAVYGEIAPRFTQEMQVSAPHIPISTHAYLQEALMASLANSRGGDVILFSPACSSFDQFQNFEHRGAVFKSLVNALTEDIFGQG